MKNSKPVLIMLSLALLFGGFAFATEDGALEGVNADSGQVQQVALDNENQPQFLMTSVDATIAAEEASPIATPVATPVPDLLQGMDTNFGCSCTVWQDCAAQGCQESPICPPKEEWCQVTNPYTGCGVCNC